MAPRCAGSRREAASLHPGEPREDAPPRGLVHRREAREFADDRPQPGVAGPHRGAIPFAEVREERRRRRARDGKRRGIGGRRGVDDHREIEPALGRGDVAGAEAHEQVVGLGRGLLDRGVALLRRQRVERQRVTGAVGRGRAHAGVEELEREVGARHEIVLANDHRVALAHAGHAHAHVARGGLLEVEARGQLLDDGERALRPLGGHRVGVEPALAVRTRSTEPLGVAHDDAARLAGPDRVEPRAVHPGRVPLEQRWILLRAGVDVGLVLGRRCVLLLGAPPDDHAVAIDAEAMKRGAVGSAKPVGALDSLGAGVEEDLVDLGDREVVIERDLDVQLLDRERKLGHALLAGAARAHRAHAVRRRLGAAIGGGEPARPVLPRHRRRRGHHRRRARRPRR